MLKYALIIYIFMHKSFYIIPLLAVSMLISCQRNDITAPGAEEPEVQNQFIPGKAIIKVSEDMSLKLNEEGVTSSGIIDGATVKRVFAHGGKYEERMRKEGLHLWYEVSFDESTPLTKVGESLLDIEGVESVEYMPVIRSLSETLPFDDPRLKNQWHYKNEGNALTGALEGCDINVVPAWNRGVTGSDKVIVAVIDLGVDATHEDLKDNMWQGVNEKGQVINGYNFVYDKYEIDAEVHGTHVAGTISAVNNNGIGVSGVAGGDAAKGIKGARIMTCEIMSGKNSGNPASAFVWAANHGAIIAQNSWGLDVAQNPGISDTPSYVKSAIDYFNTYAGCDENGNQLPDSPMKGGVVFFSAGNEALNVGYPASYEGAIAVSAISGDYKLASYSNFGEWVDIAAPGGESSRRQLILSTALNNDYESLQGTSMACPHVSGVAALIISEFGGQGFTRDDLVERLLKTAKDISLSPEQMGAGMVNASAAVAHYGEDLPNAPAYARHEEISGSSLMFKYIFPEENNGVECKNPTLYYSTEPFTEISESLEKIILKDKAYTAGDTLTFNVDGLKLNTTYYFSAVGFDVFGNVSTLEENKKIKTRDNLPPVITALDEAEYTFKQYMKPLLKFEVTDPENELKAVTYKNATAHDTMSEYDGRYVVTIDARNIAAGTYQSKIIAEDALGKTAEYSIDFTIEENMAPTASKAMENILFTSKSGSRSVNLNEFISDPDGEELTYTASSSSDAVVKVTVQKNKLSINSASFGEAEITVTGTDALQKTVSATFKVVVRDGSKAFDLYPNPVTDGKLYVRPSEAEEVNLRITGSSGAVVYDSKVATDPFEPAAADLSGLLPGVYNVKVTTNSGKSFTQNIVKL